jgi:hypothetical protein
MADRESDFNSLSQNQTKMYDLRSTIYEVRFTKHDLLFVNWSLYFL